MEAIVPLAVYTSSYTLSRYLAPEGALGSILSGSFAGLGVGFVAVQNRKIPLFPDSMGEHRSLPPDTRPKIILAKGMIGHAAFATMYEGLRLIAANRRPDASPLASDFICGSIASLGFKAATAPYFPKGPIEITFQNAVIRCTYSALVCGVAMAGVGILTRSIKGEDWSRESIPKRDT